MRASLRPDELDDLDELGDDDEPGDDAPDGEVREADGPVVLVGLVPLTAVRPTVRVAAHRNPARACASA